MSHSDTIKELPTNAVLLASTKDVENAAYKIEGKKPMLFNFIQKYIILQMENNFRKFFSKNSSGVAQTWTPDSFVESTVKSIQEKVGNDKVVLGFLGE